MSTHYCPGCTHGIAHRLVAEVIDEMGLREKTIGVASVGCSVFAYNYFNFDWVQAPHGRAPAMATGVKRVLPDRIVMTYQGDGDMASIGMGEIVHAAARGENITVIFINNANYGMTGGQMAPTTLPGQKTTSSPDGRDVETMGYPIRAAELLATLDGASYVVRRSLHDPKNIRLAKKAIRMAFEAQVRGLGLFDGGAALHLPDQLGHDPPGFAGLAGGEDDALLPADRFQSPPNPVGSQTVEEGNNAD